jgi:hypothetical protein
MLALSRVACEHASLARSTRGDCVREELSRLIGHLLGEWQRSIQQRIEVILRLL